MHVCVHHAHGEDQMATALADQDMSSKAWAVHQIEKMKEQNAAGSPSGMHLC